MYEVILLNIFVVFFAYLNSYKDFRHGLKISFILIFIFLALRYNFGNDYPNYYKAFLNINSYESINYFNNSFHTEPGWIFLCRAFRPVGFFALVIFLALFNCIVYYWFIKKYVPVKYYWLAVFLYVFNPDFMLTHASAMRQSVAIAIFLLSIPYILKRNPIKYFLCIGISYLFHSSALILIPIFLIGIFDWEINKTWAIALFVVFISLFVFSSLFLPSIDRIIKAYFARYEIYQGTGQTLNSGFGVILLSMLFIFTLYYAGFDNKKTAILFKLAILSFMFIPLSLSILLISRIGMYFTPATISIYPLIVKNNKSPFIKYFFISFLILFTLYSFGMFFNSEVYKKGFENYQTIFSDPAF